jgi:hypothetical protein
MKKKKKLSPKKKCKRTRRPFTETVATSFCCSFAAVPSRALDDARCCRQLVDRGTATSRLAIVFLVCGKQDFTHWYVWWLVVVVVV